MNQKLLSMKSMSKSAFSVLLLVFLLFFVTYSYGQTYLTVTGVVTSQEDGGPLPGVTVQSKGGKNVGVATDMKGNYSIKTFVGDRLVFSFVGMKVKTVEVKQPQINVQLESNEAMLDEVVAIGYGTVKKKEMTGAAVQIKAEQINSYVTTDMASALQGLVAGVEVTSGSGAPGEVANIQIRGITSLNGENTPLFVVDGIPQDGNPNIPTSEIETMDILKDAASCAIYGTQGAAGVILITTKQGKPGRLRVSLVSNGGYSVSPNNFPPMLDAVEGAFVNTLSLERQGKQVDDMTGGIRYRSNYFLNNNNISDILIGRNNILQDHSLTISGGSKEFTYSFMSGYNNTQGAVIGAANQRWNLRGNIGYKSNKLTLNATLSYSSGKQDKASSTSLTEAMKYQPYQEALDLKNFSTNFVIPEGGSYNDFSGPITSMIRALKSTGYTYTDQFSGSFGGQFQILPDLTIDSKIGLGVKNLFSRSFSPTLLISYANGDVASSGNNLSSVTMTSGRNNSFDWSSSINYSKSLGDHKFSVMGAYSVQYLQYEYFGASIKGVIDNQLSVLDAGTIRKDAYSDGKDYVSTLMGMISRIQYDYKGKYMFSASGRYDGSSKFIKKNRWGFFPSVSAGWNVSSEEFWKPLSSVMNSFKIRASYGTTGNQSFGSYVFQQTLSTGYDYVFGNATNDTMEPGLIYTSFANPDIKWETSKQVNLGIDWAFLKNKITFSADLYNTDKKDMIAAVTTSLSSGVGGNTQYQNVGNMRNQGMEYTLSYRDGKKVKWNASLNFTHNTNLITKLNGQDAIIYTVNQLIGGDGQSRDLAFAEGYEAGSFFLYQTNGTIKTDEQLAAFRKLMPAAKLGDLIYIDTNKDGQLNDNDRVYSGSGLADFTMGLNCGVQFKGFDLSTNWYASVGNEVLNGTACLAYNYGRHKNLLYQWSPENPTSNVPTLSYYGSGVNYKGNTDLWVEDASFLRLKQVSFGYSLPKNVLSKLHLTNFRVGTTIQNLFVITNYSGSDPEVGGDGLSTRGLDRGNYPISKVFMGNLKIGF